MEAQREEIEARNREIGLILQEARKRKDIPITTCANLIATSRRRYTAMEEGVALIGAAELEVLVEFLEISAQMLWPAIPGVSRKVALDAVRGDVLQITIEVRK